MSNNQNGGDGKKPGDPRIPKFTHAAAAAAAARVVQPGEDAGAIEALGTDTSAGLPGQEPPLHFSEHGGPPRSDTDPYADFNPDPRQQVQDAISDPVATIDGPATVAREMTPVEMQTMLVGLADSMTRLSNIVAQQIMGQSRQAMHTPVRQRHDSDQYAEVAPITLEMPTDKDLDLMQRPDRKVESVDIDVVRSMDHAQHLAFMEEYLVINIHETGEKGAENPVVLGVNGRQVAILRGSDTLVKRKYVELLLRAKPEAINTRITRGGDGEPRNHIDKKRALKHPFSINMDRNPRGRAWAQKIRSEG